MIIDLAISLVNKLKKFKFVHQIVPRREEHTG